MAASLLNCFSYLAKNDYQVTWHTTSSPALAANRNMCVDVALEGGFDWLFFWDADIQIVESDFIPKMIAVSDEYKADVVVLPYRIKKLERKYALGDEGNAITKLPEHPFEITSGATGTMLIRTSLFKHLKPPYFTFQDIIKDGKAAFWPEDFYFCDRARSHTRIMAVPGFGIYHYGQHGFTDL